MRVDFSTFGSFAVSTSLLLCASMMPGAPQGQSCPNCIPSQPPAPVRAGSFPICYADFTFTASTGGDCIGEPPNCTPGHTECQWTVSTDCLGLSQCCPVVGVSNGPTWVLWMCYETKTFGGIGCGLTAGNTEDVRFFISGAADCVSAPPTGSQTITLACGPCR